MSTYSQAVTGFCHFVNEKRTITRNFLSDNGMTESSTLEDRPDICPDCKHFNECPLLKN